MPVKTLGVFPLRLYKTGDRPTLRFGPSDINWLFDAAEPYSLSSYWDHVSGGFVRVSADVHNWIFHESIDDFNTLGAPGARSSGPAAARAAEIIIDNGFSLTEYDGLVVFIDGPAQASIDGGTKAGVFDGKAMSMAYFPCFATHMFMAHEIGHVLGYEHGHDPRRYVAGQFEGEYGDPCCIMSAETNRQAAFSVPNVNRGSFDPNGAIWTFAGPGISPAALWRYSPEYPKPLPWVRELPGSGAPVEVRLYRASHRGAGPRLLTWPMPKTHVAWHTIEYRPARDWDRNFVQNPGGFQAGAGVIVHQIRDLGARELGRGWPKLGRVCLEHTIAVPSTGDTDWSNGMVSVRVLDATDEAVTLLVGPDLPGPRTVTLSLRDEIVDENRSAWGLVRVPRVGEDCRVGYYVAETLNTAVTVTATAAARGFVEPLHRFTVNGTELGGWLPVGSVVDRVPIPARVRVDTGLGEWVEQDQSIMLAYRASGNQIILELPSGDGTYELHVKAETCEAPQQLPLASAEDRIRITTQTIVLPPSAVVDQSACVVAMRNEMRTKDRGPIKVEGLEYEPLVEQGWNIVQLVQHEHSHPGFSSRMVESVAAQLGLQSDELRSIAQELQRER